MVPHVWHAWERQGAGSIVFAKVDVESARSRERARPYVTSQARMVSRRSELPRASGLAHQDNWVAIGRGRSTQMPRNTLQEPLGTEAALVIEG